MICNAKPNFFVVLMLLALVSACSDLSNFAPVTSYFPEPSQHPGPDQCHVVQIGETLKSISSTTGLDFQSLVKWNNLSTPYQLAVGQKIRLFNPNPSVAVEKPISVIGSALNKLVPPKKIVIPAEKNQVLIDKPINSQSTIPILSEKKPASEEKKSTISIDKEKVLKLNFEWPLKGKVLKQFFQSNSKGIDIAGKNGQSVSAAEAGKVVYSGQGLLGYGNLLIIKHTDIFLSAYANNSRLLVGEGDVVNKGQAIAEVGQIGSKRASLHFEIRKNGKPVNPLAFLSKK
jgi:lipoprotein NlpD